VCVHTHCLFVHKAIKGVARHNHVPVVVAGANAVPPPLRPARHNKLQCYSTTSSTPTAAVPPAPLVMPRLMPSSNPRSSNPTTTRSLAQGRCRQIAFCRHRCHLHSRVHCIASLRRIHHVDRDANKLGYCKWHVVVAARQDPHAELLQRSNPRDHANASGLQLLRCIQSSAVCVQAGTVVQQLGAATHVRQPYSVHIAFA